jgi:hypothetical protein
VPDVPWFGLVSTKLVGKAPGLGPSRRGAVAGTGLALGEGWVTVAGLAPLLYAAPCALMIAFCMRGMRRGMQSTQEPASTPAPPVAADATRLATETEKQA